MKSFKLYENRNFTGDVKLSIVIPTYRRAKYLRNALDSIFAQNEQDCISHEVIVINNDPCDNMEDIIDNYKERNIIFFKNAENYGQVGNINQGITLANGIYIGILHDDDILLPSYFQQIAEYVNDVKRTYDCIIASYYTFQREYKIDLKHKALRAAFFYRTLYRKKLQRINCNDYILASSDIYNAPTCGTLFLKAALVKFGLFKNERGAAWDYYNFRKYNEKFDIYMLHEYVGARRLYSGMSNEDKIRCDFRNDLELLVDELAEHHFVKKYKDAILTKKPTIKYISYKYRKEKYRYTHNLDGHKSIPLKQYKQLLINGYIW